MPRAVVLGLVGLAGLAWLLTAQASAPTVYADGSAELPTESGDPIPTDQLTDAYTPDADVTALADPVLSLEYAIRCAEHSAADVQTGNDYYTFYGGSRFSDLSNHPVLTGEKKGVPLPPAMCIAAGIASGNCVSTAAGAFQLTLPTWQEFGAPFETDFSKEAQNRTAARILESVGATDALMAGDVGRAIQLAAKRWASLPGSTAGQGRRSLDFVLQAFNDAQDAQANA